MIWVLLEKLFINNIIIVIIIAIALLYITS